MRKVIVGFVLVLLTFLCAIGVAEELDGFLISISPSINFNDLAAMYPQANIDQESLYIKHTEFNGHTYSYQTAQYTNQDTPFKSTTYIIESDYSNVALYEELIADIQNGDEYPLICKYDTEGNKTVEYINEFSFTDILSNLDGAYGFEWLDKSGIMHIVGIYSNSIVNTEYYGVSMNCAFAISIEKIYTDSKTPYSMFCLGNGITLGIPHDAITSRLSSCIRKLSDDEIIIGKELFGKAATISIKFDINNCVSQMNCLFSNTTLSSFELEESFRTIDNSLGYINDPFNGLLSDMKDQSGWIEKNPLDYSSSLGFMSWLYKYSHVFDCGKYLVVHEAYMKNKQSIHTLSIITEEEYSLSLLDDLF